MNRLQRLQLMQAELDTGLAASGDERRQRQAMQAIIRQAHFAGVAVLDWLKLMLNDADMTRPGLDWLAPPYTGLQPPQPWPEPAPTAVRAFAPGQVDAIRCRKCGREFKTQTALNGHGEARCKGTLSVSFQT